MEKLEDNSLMKCVRSSLNAYSVLCNSSHMFSNVSISHLCLSYDAPLNFCLFSSGPDSSCRSTLRGLRGSVHRLTFTFTNTGILFTVWPRARSPAKTTWSRKQQGYPRIEISSRQRVKCLREHGWAGLITGCVRIKKYKRISLVLRTAA